MQLAFLTVGHRFHCIICALNFSTSAMFRCILAVFFSVSSTFHHGSVFLCVSHIPLWQCFSLCCPHSIMVMFFSVLATFHHGSVFSSCVSATFHYGNVFFLCVSHIPLWQCFSRCQPHFIMAVFFSVSATSHHGNVFLCVSHIAWWQCFFPVC